MRSSSIMLFRFLFRLINNPHMIEKLAESRPIRRAAQLTAYALTRAHIAGRDAAERALRSRTLRQLREEAGGEAGNTAQELGRRFRKVRETFVNEVKQGWKEGSRQIKK